MDFTFDEEQRMLLDSARKFFEKEAPKSLIRQLLYDEKGYSAKMWKDMCELGWPGLPFAEEYGGFGAGFSYLAILFEAIGWACVPTPYFSSVVLGGLLIQESGSKEIKRIYLPKISSGECIATMTFLGKMGAYNKNEIGVEAKIFGDGYRLNGSAFFVPYAHIADILICAARTASRKGDNITLFLIDGKALGLEVTSLKTITGQGKESMVNFKDVEISAEQILGQEGKGWDHIESLWPKITVALSCECVGGMDKVLDMTLKHVQERVQFGQPLSELQVVQHMCVDMFTKAETSRHAAHYAAWLIDKGQACEKEAAIAKSWCGEAYKDVTKIAHQVTGAIGFSEEYDLHLYTRNAKRLEVLFGNGAFQRNIIADNTGL